MESQGDFQNSSDWFYRKIPPTASHGFKFYPWKHFRSSKSVYIDEIF